METYKIDFTTIEPAKGGGSVKKGNSGVLAAIRLLLVRDYLNANASRKKAAQGVIIYLSGSADILMKHTRVLQNCRSLTFRLSM